MVIYVLGAAGLGELHAIRQTPHSGDLGVEVEVLLRYF